MQTFQKLTSPPINNPSLKRLKSFYTISLSIAAAFVAFAVTGPRAHATPQVPFVLTIQQVGSNVVATGSGSISTTGLTLEQASGPSSGGLNPSLGISFAGTGSSTEFDGSFSGPSSFGSGSYNGSSSDGGSLVGYAGNNNQYIFLPVGYTSGVLLTDTSTWTGTTLSSLGITTGSYTWTWGGGSTQSYTVNVLNSVPEPSTWAMMAAGVGVMFGFRRRRRR